MRIFFACIAALAATACASHTPVPKITPNPGAEKAAAIVETLKRSSYTSTDATTWTTPKAVAHVIQEESDARVRLIITQPEGRVTCELTSTGSALRDALTRYPERSIPVLIKEYGCLQ